ncbi:MAG: hypothetical protein SPD85_04385 [Candidatus Cryptobacteroides sp.]|nr:hypothetical protein [Candidatus Cryptobacteroides sp.]
MEKRIPPTGRGKLNLEESQKLICMSEVRDFAEFAPDVGFSEFYLYDLYRSSAHEIAEAFSLVRKEHARVRATAMEG